MPLPFKDLDQDTRNALSLAGTIGLHLVSGIAVGFFIGYMLDRWLDSSPWLTMIFLGIGIIAGFKNMFMDVKRLLPILYARKTDAERYSSSLRNGGTTGAQDEKDASPPRNE